MDDFEMVSALSFATSPGCIACDLILDLEARLVISSDPDENKLFATSGS